MNDRIILGITGSAAAFKGVALASLLRKNGFEVDAVLTGSALRFVSDTQLACVTGRPVYTDLFVPQPGDPVPHITLTEGRPLLVVAPATAACMARAAFGLGEDLLSCIYLASSGPVILAPAMNTRMWENPATVSNTTLLRERGVIIAGPEEGLLACGTTGKGRMTEPEDLLKVCLRVLGHGV